MMVIQGNTTEHSVAFSDSTGIGGNAGDLITWVYNAVNERFEPNAALAALLASTTNGPWRVVSVAALTRRRGAASNAAANNVFLAHIRFDENSNITFPGLPDAFTNEAGDQILATRGGTQIIHNSAVENSIYPADRCTWRSGPTGNRGYQIDNAVFYDGANTSGITILDPRLGYIGKSGRFVEIAG